MAKQFTYREAKTGKVIYKTTEPNYVSKEQVDTKMRKNTGTDPRLTPHLFELEIRTVDEPETKIGKVDTHTKR